MNLLWTIPNMNGHAFHLPVLSLTTGFPEKSTDPSPVYTTWLDSCSQDHIITLKQIAQVQKDESTLIMYANHNTLMHRLYFQH